MRKKNWTLALLCTLSVYVHAQIRWDGEGADNLWTTPGNWTNNIVPGPKDDVLLDNSFLLTSYTVSLAPGNVSVTINSLRITPVATVITLLVPTANISSTAITAMGVGDAIVLDNGAVLLNSSRATSGTPVSVTTTNFFRINNGGKYIHNTDNGHTNNLVARLSTAPGTEDGIFQFDVPGNGAYTISASSRTYGHLMFSAAAAGVSKIYTAAGISPFTMNGDLEILPGATLSYGATTNNLIVNKNCLVAAGAVFNISNSINNSTVTLKGNLNNQGTITETGSSTGSRIEWKGNANQQVSSTGLLSQSVTVTMNNAMGLTLLTPLVLPYNLQLLIGNIKSSATNLLTIADNGVYTGGSNASFVEGPMRKIGDDDFDFPVGIGTIYAPIGIAGGTGALADDAFTAEYIRINPQSNHGAAIDPLFNHISFVEYWQLKREGGNASKQVKLSVQQYSFARIFNTVYGSRYDGEQWTNSGRNDAIAGPIFPPNETGTIKTNETTAFGDFTLATTDDVGINPLPVSIISFTANKTLNGDNKIAWELKDVPVGNGNVEIERSTDGKLFENITSIPVHQSLSSYSYLDHVDIDRLLYYRLKIKNVDETVTYTTVIKLAPKAPAGFSISLRPNRGINTQAFLSINTPVADKVNWMVIDMQGRIVQKNLEVLMVGEQIIPLHLAKLGAGYYILTVQSVNKPELKRIARFWKN